MKKKATAKERTQATIAMSVTMQQLMLPLLLAMDATKRGLLSFVQQMGGEPVGEPEQHGQVAEPMKQGDFRMLVGRPRARGWLSESRDEAR